MNTYSLYAHEIVEISAMWDFFSLFLFVGDVAQSRVNDCAI